MAGRGGMRGRGDVRGRGGMAGGACPGPVPAPARPVPGRDAPPPRPPRPQSNVKAQVLYIQNFEMGMLDEQLRRLIDALGNGRIWAVNVGENMQASLDGWRGFIDRLPLTNCGYTYISEHHINQVRHLKDRCIFLARMNRKHFENHGNRMLQVSGGSGQASP